MVMFVERGCSELPGLVVQGKWGLTEQPPALLAAFLFLWLSFTSAVFAEDIHCLCWQCSLFPGKEQ